MHVIDVRTVLLTGPSTNDRCFREARGVRSAAFVEVHTDAGLVGLGETYAGYFCPEVVPQIVEFFRPILLGQSPDNVRDLWKRMYHCGSFWCRTGLGLIVLTGIEAALWDLVGQARAKPVCELLGDGKHEQLPCYATGGPSNGPLPRLIAKVEYYFSLGFRAIKIGAGWLNPAGEFLIPSGSEAAELEGQKVAGLRDHFGEELVLMLDGHMGNSPGATWDLATAQAVMDAVEPAGLLFFEEPLPYLDVAGYAELCASTSVPIAAGECLTGVAEWQRFVHDNCCDVGQPDASFVGGLAEFLEVSRLLSVRGRRIATHAWGAGASLMQNVHCGFAATNTLILEVPPAYGPLHSEIIGDSFQMQNGSVIRPQAPGLGIRLTEETKRRFPFVPGSGEFNSVPGKALAIGRSEPTNRFPESAPSCECRCDTK